MHRSLSCIILAVTFWVTIAASASAQSPPRVLRTVPEHGEVGVDPKLKAIRVEFDRAIDPDGRSICGGGPTLPKFDGDAVWVDAKTLSIPVMLDADKDYSLSINCQAFRHFRDADGTSVTPYPIAFKTRAAGAAAPAALTAEQNTAAIEVLRKAIDERYSYRDLRKVDWAKRFKEFEGLLIAAKSPAEFARLTAELLSAAKDIHIGVTVNSARHSAYHDAMPEANFNGKALDRMLKSGKRHNGTVVTGMLDDAIAYLLITNWSGDGKELDAALNFIDEQTKTPAMVVDVRVNGGGSELLARKIAGCFVNEKVVYAKNRNRDPSKPNGWTDLFSRELSPNADHKHFAGKVALLIGPTCMSSNESFIKMMKQSKNVTTIGATTFGSSGNPKPYKLGNGVTIVLPSWEDYFADSTPLESRGIVPDKPVKVETWDNGDPIVAEAIRRLRP